LGVRSIAWPGCELSLALVRDQLFNLGHSQSAWLAVCLLMLCGTCKLAELGSWPWGRCDVCHNGIICGRVLRVLRLCNDVSETEIDACA
jgi:hypothetical protein